MKTTRMNTKSNVTAPEKRTLQCSEQIYCDSKGVFQPREPAGAGSAAAVIYLYIEQQKGGFSAVKTTGNHF